MTDAVEWEEEGGAKVGAEEVATAAAAEEEEAGREEEEEERPRVGRVGAADADLREKRVVFFFLRVMKINNWESNAR